MTTDQDGPGRPASSGEGAFGDQLRRAREARGLALEAVAEATRIAPRHLAALERSNLDALPPGPFGKGYVRLYADVLHIDPEPILEAYRRQEQQRGLGTAEGERKMLDELSHLVARRAEPASRPAGVVRGRTVALGAAALVVVGALAWALTRARVHERPAAPAAASSPAAPAAAASPAKPPVVTARERQVRPVSRADSPVRTPTATPAGPSAARPTPPAAKEIVPPPDALEVPDHGVGTGLVARALVGRSDRFAEGTRVVFWTLVAGGRRGHTVRHVWLRDGRGVMRVDLPVGGLHWRTHSSFVLPRGSTGPWAVEARTSDGRLLARGEFVCEPVARE